MKNPFTKQSGMLLLGLLLISAIAFAADFKEIKKDIKHQIEHVVPGIAVDQADVLVHNSILKDGTTEIGQLKIENGIEAMFAIETKRLVMRDLYSTFYISWRQKLRGNGYSYSIPINKVRTLQVVQRS